MQMLTQQPHFDLTLACGRQCVVFQLGREEYGIGIEDVQEIIKYAPVTRIPNSLPFVKGVINLRGSIIPVVDLRLRVGLPGAVPTRQTCIVMVLIDGDIAGLTVDCVSDVQEFTEEDLESPPQSMQQSALDAVERIGKTAQSMVMLLDVKRLFPMETFAAIRGALK